MLHKFHKIILLNVLYLIAMLLRVECVYAAPALPPSLPGVEEQISSEDKESLISEIKHFFFKPDNEKSVSTQVHDVKNSEESEEPKDAEESFIDLGDHELPVAVDPSGVPAHTSEVQKTEIEIPSLDKISTITESQEPAIADSKVTPVPQNISPESVSQGSDIAPESELKVEPKDDVQSVPPVVNVVSDEKTTLGESIVLPEVVTPKPAPLPPKINEAAVPKPDKVVSNPEMPQALDKVTPAPLPLVTPIPTASVPQVEVPLVPVEVLSNAPKSKPATTIISNDDSQKALPAQKIEEQKNIVQASESTEPVEKQNSAAALKFAKDETQVLLLPNDDVVLGEPTPEAVLEQMNIYSYIKMVKQQEDRFLRRDRRKLVDSFISYDNELDKIQTELANKFYYCAVPYAFRAAEKNNLLGLRALLDTYPVLQQKYLGNTLLHISTGNNNYYLTKFLLIRGSKLFVLNSNCQTALDIARMSGHNNISCLLIKAGASS